MPQAHLFYSLFFIIYYFTRAHAQAPRRQGGKGMRIKNLGGKLTVTAAIIAAVILYGLLDITCPIKELTGIPCPGCGMTRAYLSLLQGDISAAFAFHPLFPTVPVAYLMLWTDGRLVGHKWVDRGILIAIAVGFVAIWIGRIFIHFS